MLDLLYIVGTLVFFVLALLFVRGCAKLGGVDEAEGAQIRVDEARTR